jgi:hypothetical protein
VGGGHGVGREVTTAAAVVSGLRDMDVCKCGHLPHDPCMHSPGESAGWLMLECLNVPESDEKLAAVFHCSNCE